MSTEMKKQKIARKRSPATPYINIRVLRSTNKRIKLWAAKQPDICTVPQAIDRMFPEE